MYNNAYTSPAFTNNPFVNDPTDAQSRFPDLSSPSPSNGTQYTQWLQPAPVPSATPYQTQPQGLYQQQQQQPQYGSVQSAYALSGSPQQQKGMPFQPSSAFGQQLAANISGSSYGYLQGQAQPQQPEYNPVQQQLQSPTYIAQLDPYASIGQGWDGQNQPQSQGQNTTATGSYSTSSSSISPSGDPHPRDYIRNHKPELEAWDSYAWKQLLNAFDALKNTWDGRTKELGSQLAQLQQQLAYSGGGYYAGQIQQEGARLQGLMKEAHSNFDSVAASSFQMSEVFQGYRQSGDLPSKRRVREACNAALQSLPDWPPNTY
ncbi:hypothetical protein L208DRAFT_1366334 [Tricholoma matsutake]|nr:hypothetical protein L208DRAFT_1366334 [Tricholoma matsutake 945]